MLQLGLAVLAVAFVAFVAGVIAGRSRAELDALDHADCSTPHHMRGGFYYIVPEGRYVGLICGRRAVPPEAPPESS